MQFKTPVYAYGSSNQMIEKPAVPEKTVNEVVDESVIDAYKKQFIRVNHVPVKESEISQKYAILANAAYVAFNNHSVEKYLESQTGYNIRGFELDESLSNQDNIVLVNYSAGIPEVVVAFRGTAKASDWATNATIVFNREQKTERYEKADELMQQVISRYGKSQVSVTGHSQGGMVSSYMGEKYNVPGHHYNPAIGWSHMQNIHKSRTNSLYTNEPVAEQNIWKTLGDPVSILALKKEGKRSGYNVHVVNPLKGTESDLLELHGLNQFYGSGQRASGEEAALGVEKALKSVVHTLVNPSRVVSNPSSWMSMLESAAKQVIALSKEYDSVHDLIRDPHAREPRSYTPRVKPQPKPVSIIVANPEENATAIM